MEKITLPFIALNWMQLQWEWQGANCAIPNFIKQRRQVVETEALCYALLFNVSVLFLLCFYTLTRQVQKALLWVHLSNDLGHVVKISPFDTANWSTCRRMFSSLVNHIYPLISPPFTPPPSDIVLLNPVYNSIVANPQWILRRRRRRERKRDTGRRKQRKENKWLRGTWDGEGKLETAG